MTFLWLALDWFLTVDKCSSITLLLTCKYEIIYFYSENSQEILWITFIKTHIQIYSNLLNQIYLFIFLTMTRDFEPVESWTAHLLRSTASKWVFLISFNASVDVKNADISESAKLSIICYICKIFDHLFKNCSQLNKINTSASHAFILRLVFIWFHSNWV